MDIVSFEQNAIYTSFISLNPHAMSALYVTVSLSMLVLSLSRSRVERRSLIRKFCEILDRQLQTTAAVHKATFNGDKKNYRSPEQDEVGTDRDTPS